MKTFQYGNFSAELDATDVLTVQRYEDAAEKFNVKISNLPKTGKASEIYSAQIAAIRSYMDDFLGAGASKKMFGDDMSVHNHVTAVTTLTQFMNDVSDTITIIHNMAKPNKRKK